MPRFSELQGEMNSRFSGHGNPDRRFAALDHPLRHRHVHGSRRALREPARADLHPALGLERARPPAPAPRRETCRRARTRHPRDAARSAPPSPPPRAPRSRWSSPGRCGARRARTGAQAPTGRPPTAPWRASRPRTARRGFCARLSPPGRLSRKRTAITARPKTAAIAEWRWTTHSRVPAPSKSKRCDELALVGPRVGAGAGRDRPGEDRQLPERDQRPDRPDAEPVAGGAPLARLVARAPGEGEGGVEEQHREDEMAHHQARGEVVLDDQGAEDRLAQHPERQQRPEDRQVPAEGPAEEGQARGGDHGEADEAGQQPVAVLDHRVGVERRHVAAVALGPVRAAEAGAGEPHAGAGQHDQRQRREGDHRHLRVELGRDAEPQSLADRHDRMMPTAAAGRGGRISLWISSRRPCRPAARRLCRRSTRPGTGPGRRVLRG